MKRAVVIGSGIAGISAASFMAQAGWEVTVLEKLSSPGGRARQLSVSGFTFDMGPSWYWMPDVFERYFEKFGKKVEDYYELVRLDPSYRIYWPEEYSDIPSDFESLYKLVESLEKGAGEKLIHFLKEASFKYRVSMQKLVFKPGLSLNEFMDWDIIKGISRMDIFSSIQSHINKYFTHPRIRQMLEFPILFLGALPEHTPALYSLMNFADIIGGTWYPKGGMYKIIEAMYSVAREQGVRFIFEEDVKEIRIRSGKARQVLTTYNSYEADVVIGGADYHFIESSLLPENSRSYSENYWEKRTMAPSCLLYYVGLNRKVKNLLHHSLFFDVPFGQHAKEIYSTPSWPSEPLFYVNAPSVTDPSVAPEGYENLTFLVPVAAGLSDDTPATRDKYFNLIIDRFEARIGEKIRDAIVVKKSFAYSDFVKDYNSFKGNAYGLANTLRQTAILKPSCRSKKVSNLFYTGQLTVPGPGVPPSLISGEIVAGEVLKLFKSKTSTHDKPVS